MKLILPLLFVALVALHHAPAARVDSGEQSIQGTWHVEGNDGRGLSWYLEWTFDKGKFNLKGYPPLYQEGSYRIIKSAAGKLTLELFDQKGNFGTENSQIEIVVGRARNKLKMIKGQGPFTRIKAQT
jgi:hypothetical protein